MAIKGQLSEMSLPALAQLTCNEGDMARLNVRQGEEEGSLYFEGGNIVHAMLGAQTGEEAVYELLTWEDGEFELESDISPPERTITVGWSGLLLEGMRRIDEHTAAWEGVDTLLFEEQPEEVHEMATRRRSEVLAEHLEELLAASGDINGAAIVGYDGLVLASSLPLKGHDATRVGAEGAALLGLSKRTLGNLKCGDFEAAILEGDEGWIIVMGGGPKAMVLGLTAADVNLGMALLEMRDIATDVAQTMG